MHQNTAVHNILSSRMWAEVPEAGPVDTVVWWHVLGTVCMLCVQNHGCSEVVCCSTGKHGHFTVQLTWTRWLRPIQKGFIITTTFPQPQHSLTPIYHPQLRKLYPMLSWIKDNWGCSYNQITNKPFLWACSDLAVGGWIWSEIRNKPHASNNTLAFMTVKFPFSGVRTKQWAGWITC